MSDKKTPCWEIIDLRAVKPADITGNYEVFVHRKNPQDGEVRLTITYKTGSGDNTFHDQVYGAPASINGIEERLFNGTCPDSSVVKAVLLNGHHEEDCKVTTFGGTAEPCP